MLPYKSDYSSLYISIILFKWVIKMGDEYEYKRALIFQERKTIVHASTKRFWTNGIILEVSKEHIVIKDREDGNEKFIFFSELIKPLEPTKEVRK